MSLDKPSQDPLDLKKLVEDVKRANAKNLMDPKIDLSSPPRADDDIPARIARNVRESERLRAIFDLTETPRNRDSSVEL